MRLDKFLADCGVGTRKDIKKLIKSGAVEVCGKTETDPSVHTDEKTACIRVNGKKIEYEKFIYLMMNKPQGYISATEDERQKTVLALLDEKYRFFSFFPAGRLDIDTEGFLLLTNDGVFAHNILSPKKHVKKTYFAKIDGEISDRHIKMFADGITLDDGYKAMGAVLKILKSGNISEIEVTLCEGKFHQVKRMFEAIGTRVIYLKRISMGNLYLDKNLSLGEVKKLTADEIAKITEGQKWTL